MSAEAKSWFCADCDAPLAGRSIHRKKDGRVICERCERTIQDKLREQAQPDLFIEQKTLFNPKRVNVNPARRRNVQGFRDHNGVFHPIRADKDYNEFLAGDFNQRERKPSLRALTKQRKEHEELERYYKDEIKELRDAELGKKSLTQFVRSMGGIVPGGMYKGEIARLSYKETGTTGLVNQKARQGNHKQTAEYVMDAANVEGYRDKHGERFTSIGDFLLAVEADAAKHTGGQVGKRRRKGVKKRRDARKMAKAMKNPRRREVPDPLTFAEVAQAYRVLRGKEMPGTLSYRAAAERLIKDFGRDAVRDAANTLAPFKRNPGLVDIAAGLQAADYLKSRLMSKRKRRNPSDNESRVLAYLEKHPNSKLGDIAYDLKIKMSRYGDKRPQDAPLNKLLLRMRDEGLIEWKQAEWGEPRISRKVNPAPAPARFPATKTPAQVTKFERIQDVDTKERGTILGHTNGWVKIKWDNRAKSTLISPDQIRIINGKLCCMANPILKTIKTLKVAGGGVYKVEAYPPSFEVARIALYKPDGSVHVIAMSNDKAEALEHLGHIAAAHKRERNPHKSYYRLATDKTRAVTKVYAKARDYYKQANKFYAEGKTKEATKLYNRADMLLKRGVASGKHTDGPVGTLPNPGLSKKHWIGPQGQQLPIYDVYAGAKKVATFYGSKVGVNMAAKRYENDSDLVKAVEKFTGSNVRLFEYKHKGGASKAVARRNPSTVRAMSERFQGRASGAVQELKAANSAPANLSRAGRLVFLKLTRLGKTVKIPGAIVCIDPKTEKLWIAGNRQPLLVKKAKKGERLDFGPIEQICYETAKKHIGNGKRFEYVHTFGEEGGNLPHLLVDDEGMPILRGGDYKITAAGIVD